MKNMAGRKQISYSFQHGGEILLHLKVLVSEVEKIEKVKSYLRLLVYLHALA